MPWNGSNRILAANSSQPKGNISKTQASRRYHRLWEWIQRSPWRRPIRRSWNARSRSFWKRSRISRRDRRVERGGKRVRWVNRWRQEGVGDAKHQRHVSEAVQRASQREKRAGEVTSPRRWGARPRHLCSLPHGVHTSPFVTDTWDTQQVRTEAHASLAYLLWTSLAVLMNQLHWSMGHCHMVPALQTLSTPAHEGATPLPGFFRSWCPLPTSPLILSAISLRIWSCCSKPPNPNGLTSAPPAPPPPEPQPWTPSGSSGIWPTSSRSSSSSSRSTPPSPAQVSRSSDRVSTAC